MKQCKLTISSDKSLFGIILSALILFLLPTRIANAQADRNFEVPPLLRDCAGIYIAELSSGRILTAQNASRLFTPASVTKVLTSAAVMNLCDSTERFMTRIDVSGRIADGILSGNIIVNTVGDPTIESRHMPEACGLADSLARTLVSLGVKRISGRIIEDKSQFVENGVAPGWMDEDLTWPYGAELFATNYRNNTITISVPSGTVSPSTPGLEVKRIPTRGNMKISRKRGCNSIDITGTRGKCQSANIANPIPWKTLMADIENTLEKSGIAINKASVSNTDRKELMTWQSPRYIDILRSMMVRSDNLMAEGMLRALAPGAPISEALLEEADVWSDYEIDANGIIVEDGSGLSRNNRLSAKFLADVLTTMAHSSVADGYLRLFPRAGRDGTLRNFMKGTPLEVRLALKTGSMRGVQSYAGYLFDPVTGRPSHVIVFIANNFSCSRGALRAEFSRLLQTLFCTSAEPDVPNN